MRNKTNIVVGVLVFLLVLTSPIWLNLGKSANNEVCFITHLHRPP